MAHLPHQAALGPCRPVYIRPEPAFRQPCLADEAVVIAAGEGSREGQGQPCVRVCRHHTLPSRQHATCCFSSLESHVEPACAQSMREPPCSPSRPLPPCPNSSVHAPISVCNTPLHDHSMGCFAKKPHHAGSRARRRDAPAIIFGKVAPCETEECRSACP